MTTSDVRIAAEPKLTAREANETIRYTCWTTFKRIFSPSDSSLGEFNDLLQSWSERDITVRGLYDVSGLRADADVMTWLHAPTADMIQQALRELRQSDLGQSLEMTWSGMGMHRPAEFNESHVPSFMLGKEPKDWVSVYPFVRSYEWYLLPDDERREMLFEHGMMGRDYGGILSNTVAAFALGDYEWLLALESDDLDEIVDMMRTLRSAKARLHVREEIPFFTGRRVDAATWVASLK
jgi:chlorite dismutase